jgi:hypothetical protein
VLYAGRRCLQLALLGLMLRGISLIGQQPALELPTAELQGAWQQVGAGDVVNIKGDQLFRFDKGKLSVLGIVHCRQGVLVVRNIGELETWQASVKGGLLRLGRSEVRTYRRLPQVPPQLDLHAAAVGTAHPLPPERIKEITGEVLRRFQYEQEVLKDRVRAPAEGPSLREDNRRYLTRLVQEVGWLDTARFGEKTSVDATILLKHTGDLPLAMAALPYVERDLKLTGDGQTYAVLFDDLQLQMGRKQRYGTQIGEDGQGNPYVLPLEEPAKVDDYLKAIGLPPLENYMKDVSKYLYGGKLVRLARPEEAD